MPEIVPTSNGTEAGVVTQGIKGLGTGFMFISGSEVLAGSRGVDEGEAKAPTQSSGKVFVSEEGKVRGNVTHPCSVGRASTTAEAGLIPWGEGGKETGDHPGEKGMLKETLSFREGAE